MIFPRRRTAYTVISKLNIGQNNPSTKQPPVENGKSEKRRGDTLARHGKSDGPLYWAVRVNLKPVLKRGKGTVSKMQQRTWHEACCFGTASTFGTKRTGTRSRLTIENGPFQGLIGSVEREWDDGKRVMLLLEAMQHARVLVDRRCLSVASSVN